MKSPTHSINYIIYHANLYLKKKNKVKYIKPIITNFVYLSNYEQINKIELDTKYLPNLNEYIENSRCTIIRSDPGSGKTHIVADYLKSQKNFICLTCRQTLTKQICDTCKKYNIDVKSYKNGVFSNKFVTSIESFYKYSHKLNLSEKYCLYIDEIDSFVKYIADSKTLEYLRTDVYNSLDRLLSNPNVKVIVTDADISNVTVDYLLSFFNPSEITFINNKEQNINKNAVIVTSKKAIMKKIIDDINAGGRPWICCDQKRTVDYVYYMLTKIYKISPDDIVAIHSVRGK